MTPESVAVPLITPILSDPDKETALATVSPADKFNVEPAFIVSVELPRAVEFARTRFAAFAVNVVPPV
jgi:hypothetical protein